MGNFVMERLRRKIDDVLAKWGASREHMPLIITGARQIGKTKAISRFARLHYRNVIEINFVLQKEAPRCLVWVSQLSSMVAFDSLRGGYS